LPIENGCNWDLKGPELVVDCYLRLNGYFIVNNFILHDQHGGQKTEVDLIGVRFSNQVEIIEDSEGKLRVLENDLKLVRNDDFVDVVIAEVKKGEADINGPFKKEEVLEYILNWSGCLDDGERVEAIKCLKRKEDFRTSDGRVRVRFVCFGEPSRIRCKQITLLDALKFTRERFKKYGDYKTHSDQWTGVMKYVYTFARSAISDKDLLMKILEGEWILNLKEPE
jgi:hypothetical protein